MSPEIQPWNDALEAAAAIVRAQHGDSWIVRDILELRHAAPAPLTDEQWKKFVDHLFNEAAVYKPGEWMDRWEFLNACNQLREKLMG